LRRPDPARLERIPCGGLGLREFDSGLFSKLIISARDQLWTSAALAVDGLPLRLRRFRKSHQLIPASSGARSEDCNRQRRIKPTGVGLLRAYQTIVSESFSENGKVETEMSSSKASSIP
jgi:hypothetical protein